MGLLFWFVFFSRIPAVCSSLCLKHVDVASSTLASVPVSSASLMLELTFDLVLTFDADVYFYYVCFFLCFFFFLSFFFFFLCCQIGFARTTAEGEIFKLAFEYKKSIFLESS